METLILIGHVLAALALVGLILLQQGKGAEAGASFGGGASQTIFGSQGAGNFLTRITAILATVFFITSFSLALLAKNKAGGDDIDPLEEAIKTEQPAIDSDVPTLDESTNKKSEENDVPTLDVQGGNEAESTPASEGSEVSGVETTEQLNSDQISGTSESTEETSSEVIPEQ